MKYVYHVIHENHVMHNKMKKTKIIAEINQKGGVGKTSGAINKARLAAHDGKKVLLIDLDHQANSSMVFGVSEATQNICHIFEQKNIDVTHVIHKAKKHDGSVIDNLDIIPANIRLSRVIENSLTRTHRESILINAISPVLKKYDIVLIDCPPNLNIGVINAILASNIIVIPVSGKFSLDGVSDLLDLAEEVKNKTNFNYKVYRNGVDQRNKIINSYIIEQLDSIKNNVCNTCISQSQSIEKANANNMSLLDYEPTSKIIKEYQNLLEEIIQ